MNQLLDQGIQINKELFMNYQLLIWLLSFGDCHLWHLGEKCSLKGVVRGSCEIVPRVSSCAFVPVIVIGTLGKPGE